MQWLKENKPDDTLESEMWLQYLASIQLEISLTRRRLLKTLSIEQGMPMHWVAAMMTPCLAAELCVALKVALGAEDDSELEHSIKTEVYAVYRRFADLLERQAETE